MAPAEGFCSGTLEFLSLKALKPWKPATLDSWSFVTFEPWNPAALESCNPDGALEPWNFRPFASLEPALGTLKLYLKQYGSLSPWNFETRKLGVLEVWASRVMVLWKTWSLATLALLTCLETKNPVKNFEPFTFWNFRDIMPTLRSLNNVRQFYCVLRLLCIALVMNQTKTLQVWNLDAWNLEPWKLGAREPCLFWSLDWNLGTTKICNLAIPETCNCGILEPCQTLEPYLMTLLKPAAGLQGWVN